MSDLGTLKALLEQHGVFTRLVPCRIEFDYTELDSEGSESSLPQGSLQRGLQVGLKSNLHEELRAEFIALSSHRHSSLNQWLNKIKSKARNEETDEVLLELLVELYRKVEHIEQILLNQNRPFVPLGRKASARFIGHNVLCVNSESSSESSATSQPKSQLDSGLNLGLDSESAPLSVGREYYLRLFLPIFPQRYVGIYAKALSEEILCFTQIHPNDVRDFDSFVAFLEREAILDLKLQRQEEE